MQNVKDPQSAGGMDILGNCRNMADQLPLLIQRAMSKLTKAKFTPDYTLTKIFYFF